MRQTGPYIAIRAGDLYEVRHEGEQGGHALPFQTARAALAYAHRCNERQALAGTPLLDGLAAPFVAGPTRAHPSAAKPSPALPISKGARNHG